MLNMALKKYFCISPERQTMYFFIVCTVYLEVPLLGYFLKQTVRVLTLFRVRIVIRVVQRKGTHFLGVEYQGCADADQGREH